MYDAQYLFKSATVFSPWFSRQGDNIRVSAELIDESTADFELKLYHKNREDPGDGDPVDTTKLELTSTGRDTHEWTGLKELVRYQFHATGTAASDYVLFRTLDPVWFDAVKG